MRAKYSPRILLHNPIAVSIPTNSVGFDFVRSRRLGPRRSSKRRPFPDPLGLASSQREEGIHRAAVGQLHPAPLNRASPLTLQDRASQRAGLIMAAIYRTLLEEIRRDRFEVLDRRIALTPLRKFWIAWKTWVTSK